MRRRNRGLIFYERRKRINRDLLREIGYYLLTTVLAVFLAACAVFFFGFRITVIGPSMEPTLSGGQSVFVNRISTRMGIIHRGTVIAFYPGGNHSAHPYIKRPRIPISNAWRDFPAIPWKSGTAFFSSMGDLLRTAPALI